MRKLFRIKLAFAFFSLFALISMVQETYTKYNTEAMGNATMSIARWQISVNNQDIVSSSFLTNTITPTILESTHVKSGVIAPKSVGYFDLVLDYTNVDTSFEWTLVTSVPATGGVSDLKVTGYSEDGGPLTPVTGQITNITQQVLLNDTQRTKTMRIYITWDDGAGTNMDNAQDTEATLKNLKATLNVLLNFKQIT